MSMNDGQALWRTYPRSRPPLPSRHAAIFSAMYKENRSGSNVASGLAQKLEAWMHRRVAAVSGDPVLELGAGTLNHLDYEPDAALYDVVEPFTALYEGQEQLKRVRSVFAAQSEIKDRSYARIISIAVLEHMLDLPREIALSCTKLKDGGVFQAGIPSEGGFLWWLGWRGTTGLFYFLQHGLDYGRVMRHEHVSRASEIVSVVRSFFDHVTVQKWPTGFEQLSFYQYIEARGPRRDLATSYLAEAGA